MPQTEKEVGALRQVTTMAWQERPQKLRRFNYSMMDENDRWWGNRDPFQFEKMANYTYCHNYLSQISVIQAQELWHFGVGQVIKASP